MNEKLLWFNPDIQYMFHSNIVEYDMKAMSVSISERYKLLDAETITMLKLLPKKDRTKKVGLIQKDNPEFSKCLIECELDTRRKFLEINGLDESNVLSLHSDACIFKSNKEIITNIDGVEFHHDGTWEAWINYNGIEMFYNDKTIEFKGAPQEALKVHSLGMNHHIMNIFDKIENYDEDILDYMAKFQTKYIQYKLPDMYYVPFGRAGEFMTANLQLLGFLMNVVLNEMKGW